MAVAKFARSGARVGAVCLLLALAACGGGSGSAVPDLPAQGVEPGGAGGGATIDGSPGGQSPASPPVPDTVAPSASFVSAPPALFKDQPVVVAFSEPMDTGSLALAGDLASLASASWSSRGDVLTLTPGASGWTRGPGHAISIQAKDLAGNALTPLRGEFLVRLDFSNNQPALAVIGQTDFSGVYANQPSSPGQPTQPPSASNLNSPVGNPLLTPDGRLIITDTVNNRLLVFSAIPTSNGATAAAVIGQDVFTTATGTIDAAHRIRPRGMAVWGDRFLVSDYGADRVVIYDRALPVQPAVSPTVPVGVPNFTIDTTLITNTPPCTASRLRQPTGIALTPDGKLLVSDSGHNRILIWNQIPTSADQPADLVLGQPGLTSCSANAPESAGGAPVASARSLSSPAGLWTDGTRLVVIDAGNHRALVWNQFPQSSFQPADLVLGQPDFMTAAEVTSPTASTVSSGMAGNNHYGEVTSNGVQLAITDLYANRVLIWDSFPTRNFQPADRVLGQASFTAIPYPCATNQASLCGPTGVLMTPEYLLVANGQRVSVFKSN